MSNFKYRTIFFIIGIFACACLLSGRDWGFYLFSGYAFGIFSVDFVENIVLVGDKK